MILNKFILKVKKWAGDNSSKIIIIASVILFGIFSFWLGRITSPIFEKSTIIINQTAPSALTDKNAPEQGTNQEILGAISNGSNNASSQGLFVASKKSTSKAYHKVGSYWATKIKPENQIWFDSEEQAQKAGYRPAAN